MTIIPTTDADRRHLSQPFTMTVQNLLKARVPVGVPEAMRLVEQGDLNTAVKALGRGIRMQERSIRKVPLAALHFVRGRCFDMKDETNHSSRQAVRDFTKCLELMKGAKADSESAHQLVVDALVSRGKAFGRMGDLEQGLRDFDEVASRCPGRAEPYLGA